MLFFFALLIPLSAFAQFDVIWERTGPGPQSRYGSDIFSLGDQDGDGYDEFGICALGWGNIGNPSDQIMELFRGGSPPETEPYMVFRSDVVNGLRVSPGWCVGDFNGDSHRDWFNFYWDEESPMTQMRVYWGGTNADSISDWANSESLSYTPVNFIGGNKSRGFDFNGDGFDDLYFYDFDFELGEMYLGGANPDTLPDWTIHDGDQSQLGIMQAFGDLNGDGFDDMLSWNNSPGLKIFLGGTEIDTIPSYIVEGVGGSSKYIVPDLNGDGKDEIIILGEPSRVFLGRDIIRTTPDFEFNFECDTHPNILSGVGDVNDDGHGDFVVIDEWCNDIQTSKACLYLGYNWLNPDPPFCWLGGQAPLFINELYTAGAVGDVNGDGVDDFGIGALGDLNWPGQAAILAGDPGIIVDADDTAPIIPQELSLSVYPNPFNAQATIEFDLPQGARRIEIKIYNTLGQVVHAQSIPAMGMHMKYYWQADNTPSGLYFARVSTGTSSATTKLVLLR